MTKLTVEQRISRYGKIKRAANRVAAENAKRTTERRRTADELRDLKAWGAL